MNKSAKMMLLSDRGKKNQGGEYDGHGYGHMSDSRMDGGRMADNRAYDGPDYMGDIQYNGGMRFDRSRMNDMGNHGNHRYGTRRQEEGDAPFGEVGALTMEDAEEWVNSMSNEDGTHGAHWTIDQVKQVMAQRKIDCDPVEMWAAMNMIYSDYYKAAKKHGVGGNLDFYIDMAKAFLDDKDARKNKISAYYEYIAK